MTSRVLLALLLPCALVPATLPAQPPPPRELGPGLFVMGSSDKFASANMGWITFADHVMLVGAPHPDLLARALVEVKARTTKPVRGAIVTHIRAGEVESVKALAREKMLVVVSTDAAKALRAAGAEAPFQEFVDRVELKDGSARVDVIALGPASGPADSAVLVHGAGVLFAGEICSNGPRADLSRADTGLWLEALDRLEKLDPKAVVPGFGTAGGKDLLEREERFLRELRRQVAFGVVRGLQAPEVIAGVRIPAAWLVWMPYDTPAPQDIERVYRELTVPEAPFGRRPFLAEDTRPRALALIGDHVHDPEHIEAGLARTFEAAGFTARFLFDYRGLTPENLKAVALFVILRDGTCYPNGADKPFDIWMTAEQEKALVDFVEAGGGLLALHNSTGLYRDGGPYLQLLGGTYAGHGPLERFQVKVVDAVHPVTKGVQDFDVADEQHTPVPDKERVHFLLESRSDEGVVGHGGWVYERGRGRVCYLANGHTRESLMHPMVQLLMRNGMRWCARVEGEK